MLQGILTIGLPDAIPRTILFATFCMQRKKLNKNYFKKFYSIIFLFLLSIFIIKNFIRIIRTDYYVNYPFPRFYSHSDDNIKSKSYESKTINEIIIHKEKNGLCMYNRPICTPYEINIEILKLNGYLVFKKS